MKTFILHILAFCSLNSFYYHSKAEQGHTGKVLNYPILMIHNTTNDSVIVTPVSPVEPHIHSITINAGRAGRFEGDFLKIPFYLTIEIAKKSYTQAVTPNPLFFDTTVTIGKNNATGKPTITIEEPMIAVPVGKRGDRAV